MNAFGVIVGFAVSGSLSIIGISKVLFLLEEVLFVFLDEISVRIAIYACPETVDLESNFLTNLLIITVFEVVATVECLSEFIRLRVNFLEWSFLE